MAELLLQNIGRPGFRGRYEHTGSGGSPAACGKISDTGSIRVEVVADGIAKVVPVASPCQREWNSSLLEPVR